MKKYVSDIISNKEINTWSEGENIQIHSETGSGKTYWAINTLAPYCKSNNQRILFLVHRRALHEQVSEDIKLANMENTIKVETYQSIITKYKFGALQLAKYDIIIFDEFQFLVQDANFIADTEIIYNLIKLDMDNIKIFISANNIDFGLSFDQQYVIGDNTKDISDRINAAMMVSSRHHFKLLIEDILENTNDKIFCYINNNDIMTELIMEFKDEVALYVSQDNPLYRHVNIEDIRSLAIDNKVDKKIILANSSMDAGVSIIDKDLKHVIAEERDIEKLYQVIGRKRLIDGERFNLYLVNLHAKMIAGYKSQVLKQIRLIDEYNHDDSGFCRKYGRSKLNNTIFYTNPNGLLKVNQMAIYYLKHILEQYDRYLKYGYKEVLEKEFNIDFLDLEYEKERENMEQYLKTIVGIPLYKDKQEDLINKISLKDNRGRIQKAFTTLEAYLENETDYRLIRKRNYSKKDPDKYNKTYWMVI